MNARATRFPLFDSVRALAALSIIGVHGAFPAGIYEGDFLRQFAARLDVGVAIFFAVSGFLLYRPFVRARVEDEPRPATGAYAWRRFLRIVPAYWVALTVIALVQLEHSEVFSLGGILTFYGFAQVYQASTALEGIPQAWTLCVEVAFYAFLPIWALVMSRVPGGTRNGRLRAELLAIALLFAASLVWKIVLVERGALTDPALGPYMLSLPAFLDQFAIGMALAVLSVRYAGSGERPGPVRLVERWPSAAWLGALLAFWLVSTQMGMTGRFGEMLDRSEFFARHLLFGAVALGVVLPAVFGEPDRGVVRRILANRVLLYLGLVSYGLYLWHSAAFEQLGRWGFAEVADSTHPFAWYLAGGALTLVLASASYYAIERPALGLRRLVGRADPSPPGEALREPAPVSPGVGTQAG